MSSLTTNINASRAEHAMSNANRDVAESTNQLSTGRRINSAADDTAGMAIRSKLSAESVSLLRAMRNANDGISMLQTADGAVGGMSDVLIRMREIAIQAANGTNSDSDRNSLDNEFSQLRQHLNDAISSTKWNGQKMLDGSMGTVNLQIGASSRDTQTLDLFDFKNLSALSAAGVSTTADALSSMTAVNSSLSDIDSVRVQWGAAMNRLAGAGDLNSSVALHLDESRSKIVDADYAKVTADLAKAQILQMAGKAMLSQANQVPIGVLQLLR